MHQVPQPPPSPSRATGPTPESLAGPRCAASRCRGVADGRSRLCFGCLDRVRRDLAGIPGLYDECETVLGHSAYHFNERVSGSKGAGIPLNPAALAARSQIMGTLASWSGLVLGERGLCAAPQRTAAGLASFLAAHADWLAAHPAAGDFADEVAGAMRMARTATRPGPTLHIELGTCVQPGCESALFAIGRAGDDRPMNQVRCGAGHAWSARDWLMVAHRLGSAGRGADRRAHSRSRADGPVRPGSGA